jgi:hypothetical protein
LQDRFAFCSGGETTEKEQNEENEFYFRLADASGSELVDDRAGPARHEPECDQHRDHEYQEPEIVIGKELPKARTVPKSVIKHAAKIILPIAVSLKPPSIITG